MRRDSARPSAAPDNSCAYSLANGKRRVLPQRSLKTEMFNEGIYEITSTVKGGTETIEYNVSVAARNRKAPSSTTPGQRSPGAIVLIGGKEPEGSPVFPEMFKLNNAKIAVLISSAGSEPESSTKAYAPDFQSVAYRPVIMKTREDAANEDNVKLLQDADLFFFSGGDQKRLVEILSDTPAIDMIKKRHLEGATVAGTSAGATAAGPLMIYDIEPNQYSKGFAKDSFRFSTGFHFLSALGIAHMFVDTHFFERNRYARIAQAFAMSRVRRAIGVSENTWAIVNPDGLLTVGGEGVVMMIKSDGFYTNRPVVEDKENVTIGPVQHYYLFAGIRFNLNLWEIVEVAQ